MHGFRRKRSSRYAASLSRPMGSSRRACRVSVLTSAAGGSELSLARQPRRTRSQLQHPRAKSRRAVAVSVTQDAEGLGDGPGSGVVFGEVRLAEAGVASLGDRRLAHR